MRLESLIQCIEREQATLAADALARPSGREAFDYGRVVGIYEGFERAKQAIIAMVAEKERKDFNL